MRYRFVYYRVAERDTAVVVAVVCGAQAHLSARWPGLACQLMRAEGSADAQGRVTLMETYRADDALPVPWQDIERELRDGLARWNIGERHVEDFRPCA